MTTEQSVLLKLIRQSQFDTVEDITWDNIDLDELYEEASQQAVLGLIAPLIPVAYSNDTWRKAQLQQEASYIRYCFAQDELKKVLDDANIPFVILKGNAAAINYKEPMRRAMGDIDFIVSQNLFEATKEVLNNNGFEEGTSCDRHITYCKNGTSYELHHHFSSNIDIECYITDGLNKLLSVSIDEHPFSILPKLSNGLVLLDHIRRHLKSGLGLRQIIDWMMYVYHDVNDTYWVNELGPVVKEKGMESLAIIVTRVCQIYLGLPHSIYWCKDANEHTCNLFIESILNSGNFGEKQGIGSTIVRTQISIRRLGLFRWLQYAGERNWNAYHRHHWLKPFCWFYQALRYFKQILLTRRPMNQLKRDFESSNKQWQLLNDLGISELSTSETDQE